MKNIFFFALMTVAINASAQQTILFQENFDLPSGADSVSTGYLSGTNPPLWSTTTSLATSPTQSYKVAGSMASRVYFETQSFSTAGSNAVYLSFKHIAKIHFLNSCKIYISTNNGSTWTQLTATSYFGSSSDFGLMNYFNEVSYFSNNNLWGFQASGAAAIPQPSWWVNENFDLSNLAVPSSGPGYTQVKLRFEADFTNVTPFGAGWFVDDLKVIGAPCELIKPKISFYASPAPCQDTLLTGEHSVLPAFSRQNSFDITDNQQLDSVRAVEIINGGAPSYSSGLAATGSVHRHFFSGYNPGDTVQWAIEAYDICGNLGRFPDTGYYMFYFSDLPAKCVGGDCNSAHQMIKSFPWKEDFEGPQWIPGTGNGGTAGRGSMPNNEFYQVKPAINQNFGWSVYSGPSTSTLTGTIGDHTSGSGNYLYTDFSSRTTISSSTFELPCIDLTDSVSRTLTFYYHCYGSDIDRLKVDIDTTPGTTEVWEPYLKLLGEQQTSNTDPWKRATISLEPFKGKILKLRFFGKTFGATTALADIAIDDISIENASLIDLELISLSSPDIQLCAPSSSVPVTIIVFNNGATTITDIPVAYQLDNLPVIYDTIKNVSLKLADSTSFTFAQTLTYSTSSTHTFKAWVNLSNDANFNSDTLVVLIPEKASALINSFPHFQNFETATTSSTGNGNLNTSFWTLNTNPNLSNTRWVIREGIQNDGLDDLTRALGKDGKHITLKMDSVRTNDFARIESGCIDLSGLTNPVLQFQYHVFTSGVLYVDIKEPGQPWTTLSTISNTLVKKEPMAGHFINLSPYAGKIIQISFRGRNIGNTTSYIASIDDITIHEQQVRDLALRHVALKGVGAGANNIANLNCEYTYFGGTTSSPFYTTLQVELSNICNPAAPKIGGSSDSLIRNPSLANRNATIPFTNLNFSQPLPEGVYTAKYWLKTTLDQFAPNDTFYTTLTAVPLVPLPYFNDFEGCNDEVYINGHNNQWEITTPNKAQFTQAKAGQQCAITNSDSTVSQDISTTEILRMPDFEGMDTLHKVELRFWQKFDFNASNNLSFGIVEIDDNGWKALDNQNLNNQNWSSLMGPVIHPTNNTGFTGNSGGWVYSTYPLIQHQSPGKKAIRFTTYRANGSPGWAIDDFEIFVPPQNSGSPEFLSFVGNTPFVGANTLALKIKNSGAAPLSQVRVIIESNGNILHQEKIVFSSPVNADQSRTVTLSQPIGLNSSIQELVIRTSLPNNRLDIIPTDDTLRVPLSYLPDVTALPVCFGFETNSTFLDFDTKSSSLDTLWKLGTPAKGQINSAHTGSKAWFTRDSLYHASLDQHLYTPFYPVNQDSCYRFSFWQNFDTEKNFDGGNVEFTLDSGLTWQTLGRYWSTDSLWYNIPFVKSLDYVKPGFSGNSGGWTLAQNDFKVFANSALQFRFRFASDADISGEGWAIDDVCLEPIGSNCNTIGLVSQDLVSNNAYLYPVPTTSSLNLRADLNGIHQLIIYDQRGAVVRKWNTAWNPAAPEIINIVNLPAGVYWLQIESTNEPIILKFIKQ